MASVNRVCLIGNLTRDPELRYIPSGTAVATLGLAMNRTYTTQDGERREEVCYVDIEAWGKTAENCANYLSKGRQICVEGSLKYDSWETEDGQKRSKLRVRASRVTFLGSGRSESTSGAEGMGDMEADDDIPF